MFFEAPLNAFINEINYLRGEWRAKSYKTKPQNKQLSPELDF